MPKADPALLLWDERLPDAERSRLTPKRFRVVFLTSDRQEFSYKVCTCLDARKALAMAAGAHLRDVPGVNGGLYEVQEVVFLGAADPQPNDIVDRMEW